MYFSGCWLELQLHIGGRGYGACVSYASVSVTRSLAPLSTAQLATVGALGDAALAATTRDVVKSIKQTGKTVIENESMNIIVTAITEEIRDCETGELTIAHRSDVETTPIDAPSAPAVTVPDKVVLVTEPLPQLSHVLPRESGERNGDYVFLTEKITATQERANAITALAKRAQQRCLRNSGSPLSSTRSDSSGDNRIDTSKVYVGAERLLCHATALRMLTVSRACDTEANSFGPRFTPSAHLKEMKHAFNLVEKSVGAHAMQTHPLGKHILGIGAAVGAQVGGHGEDDEMFAQLRHLSALQSVPDTGLGYLFGLDTASLAESDLATLALTAAPPCLRLPLGEASAAHWLWASTVMPKTEELAVKERRDVVMARALEMIAAAAGVAGRTKW